MEERSEAIICSVVIKGIRLGINCCHCHFHGSTNSASLIQIKSMSAYLCTWVYAVSCVGPSAECCSVKLASNDAAAAIEYVI